jgi:hypothetical protein
VETIPNFEILAAFLRGEYPCICSDVEGQIRFETPRPDALLPGSFNPIHEGHWGLAAAVERMTGKKVAFELSVTNVDKPSLKFEEVQRRLTQFKSRAPIWLTQAPAFAEKARLFPGAIFVIGADTAQRLIAPQYYENRPELMANALGSIQSCGCRFLVAGRQNSIGQFIRLPDIDIPEVFRDMFMEIPESEFRFDLSSSRIRHRSE